MNSLEYSLLNEEVVVDFNDISNTEDIKVIMINDIFYQGKSILDKIINTKHFSHITNECEKRLKEI